MRFLIAILVSSLLATPATSEVLELDAGKSLSELETDLAARADPTGAERFALGAVEFLRGVERSLQTRYRSNAAVGTEWMEVPLLRLPFEPNPDPEPFQPEVIRSIFEDIARDMTTARATLETAELGPEDAVRVNLSELWFDIDGNGERSADEGLVHVGLSTLADPRVFEVTASDQLANLTVQFDAADVHWFIAYTHFLSAVSEFVVAFDPTEPVRRMIESRAAMAEIGGPPPPGMLLMSPDDAAFFDAFAAIYGALNKVPDQTHLAAASDHFLSMVAANRRFWETVRTETDDTDEWIPNATQTAALGFDMPPETGETWLQVLSDAEAVLKGELLVGHWRLGQGAGVNVAKMIEDPPAVDIVTWMQGQGLQPYMVKGPRVTGQSFGRFMAMFRGNGLLFMVLLN